MAQIIITYFMIDRPSQTAMASDSEDNWYHIYQQDGKWYDLDTDQQVFFAHNVNVAATRLG